MFKTLAVIVLSLLAAPALAEGEVPEALEDVLELENSVGRDLWALYTTENTFEVTGESVVKLSEDIGNTEFPFKSIRVLILEEDNFVIITKIDGNTSLDIYPRYDTNMFILLKAMDYLVTIDDLCVEFKKNTLAAERKYEGAMIGFVGLIDSIGKMPVVDTKTIKVEDAYYIQFQVATGLVAGLPPIVRYYLDNGQLDDALELSPGDHVIVEGRIKEFGAMSLDLEGGDYVMHKLTEEELASLGPAESQ
jgi:hypothetical protein